MLQIFLIALSLAMDAFAVSISTGISTPGFGPKRAARIGLWCGAFQFGMPLIGGNMIWEAVKGGEEEALTELSVKRLFLLALATSIDALAVGVTLAFQPVNILLSAGVIGVVAFALAMLGGLLGRRLGELFQRRATILGGLVLIGIGLKILFEHLA